MTQFKWTKEKLKECIGLNTDIPWKEVYLEIKYSNSGRAVLYIKGSPTPFYAGGYGYDKTSQVLSNFMAYYTGNPEAGKDSCAGANVIADTVAKLGIKLEYITQLAHGYLYKITKFSFEP